MSGVFRRRFDYAIRKPSLFLPKGIYITIGPTCWGHQTGVTQTNIRAFQGNWTGTGSIENTGDSERIKLEPGQYMISEVVETGAVTVTLGKDVY
jgi:hypothetical protein